MDEDTRKKWTQAAIERSVRFPEDLEMWLRVAGMCGCMDCYCCFVKKNEYEIRKENNRIRLEQIKLDKGCK